MLFRWIVVLFCVSALIFSGAANALEVNRVSDDLVDRFQRASPSEARRFLADYTILVKMGRIDGRARRVLPISSVAVLYFASNGTVLGWSDETDTIEAGQWQIKTSRTGYNDICLFFPEGQGEGVCTSLIFSGGFFVESVKGNPFGLRGEQAVPYGLGRFGVSLQNIGRKLGL